MAELAEEKRGGRDGVSSGLGIEAGDRAGEREETRPDACWCDKDCGGADAEARGAGAGAGAVASGEGRRGSSWVGTEVMAASARLWTGSMAVGAAGGAGGGVGAKRTGSRKTRLSRTGSGGHHRSGLRKRGERGRYEFRGADSGPREQAATDAGRSVRRQRARGQGEGGGTGGGSRGERRGGGKSGRRRGSRVEVGVFGRGRERLCQCGGSVQASDNAGGSLAWLPALPCLGCQPASLPACWPACLAACLAAGLAASTPAWPRARLAGWLPACLAAWRARSWTDDGRRGAARRGARRRRRDGGGEGEGGSGRRRAVAAGDAVAVPGGARAKGGAVGLGRGAMGTGEAVGVGRCGAVRRGAVPGGASRCVKVRQGASRRVKAP